MIRKHWRQGYTVSVCGLKKRVRSMTLFKINRVPAANQLEAFSFIKTENVCNKYLV